MLKRIVFLFVIGFFVTPAAFAKQGKLGRIAPSGTACGKNFLDKDFSTSNVEVKSDAADKIIYHQNGVDKTYEGKVTR